MNRHLERDEEKKRRENRRRNHLVKDLRTPKYKQQIIPKKRIEDNDETYDS